LIGAILTLAILILQIYYGVIPTTLSWQALKSFAWPYILLILVLTLISAAKAPVVLDKSRKQEIDDLQTQNKSIAEELLQAKQKAQTIEYDRVKSLQEKIRELETSIEADKKSQKVRLSFSIKTEEGFKPVFMRMSSQFSGEQHIHAHVSGMSLVIYNHGEKSVRLRGYKLWKHEAVEPTEEIALHDVVSPDAPNVVDVTQPLLRVISGAPTSDFESLPGKCTVRFVVTYSEDSVPVDGQPYDFELTCKRWGGGTTLKIEAREVHQQQF